MPAIPKGLGCSLAEITRPVKERTLSFQLTNIQEIGRVLGNLEQAFDSHYR